MMRAIEKSLKVSLTYEAHASCESSGYKIE